MKDVTISESVKYIGVDDTTIDLFESQYHVPNGVSYNSYVILDEKDGRDGYGGSQGALEWLRNLDKELKGRNGGLPDRSSPGAGSCRKHSGSGGEIPGYEAGEQRQGAENDSSVL